LQGGMYERYFTWKFMGISLLQDTMEV
jgi:hypothetical protein